MQNTSRIAFAILTVLLAGRSAVGDDGAMGVLSEEQLPNDRRLGPLADLNGYFPYTPPQSVADWKTRSEEVRRRILVATGLWPMPKPGPLNPVIHGRVERDDYTIERVYFESYPGHFVTGSLYRPKNLAGKLPGLLCPHGHFPDGRFGAGSDTAAERQIAQGAERLENGAKYPLQAACVQLARMGCVALLYDMVGYADSTQIPYEVAHFYSLKRPQMDGPDAWGFFSPQADLRLQSVMGLQTYNSIRALDFLCGLPDVDASRIGVTGASSGGTQTMMLCAIDPRPSVAVPIVMVSTGMQGGCTCENCNLLRIGTGNVEFAALFTPKPMALVSANDWTKEIATKGGPELAELYALLNAREKLSIEPFLQFGHNFNGVSREAMYGHMNKHLALGRQEPVTERDFVPLSRDEMTVWDEAHPSPPAGDDYERRLLLAMTTDADGQLATLTPHDEQSLAEFRRVVGGAWCVLIGRDLPKADDTALQIVGAPVERNGCVVTKGLLRNVPHQEELPVIILSPPATPLGTGRTVIWLGRRGKAGLFAADGAPRAEVLKLVAAGTTVVGVDLLYQGEFLADGQPLSQTRQVPTKNNRDSAAYTFGYNHSLFVQRVHDVLTAVAYFGQRSGNAQSVDLVALDGAGHWAAAARAIASDTIGRAVIDTDGFRFARLTNVYDPDFVPGAAKYLDLEALLALGAPGELWLQDEAIKNDAACLVKRSYQATGDQAKLTVISASADEAAAAVNWLQQRN